MANCRFESPFGTIESAQEYMKLLADAVLEAKHDVEAEVCAERGPVSSRRADALRVVLYSLDKLDRHIQASRRMLKDLRSLRRIMLQERTVESLNRPSDRVLVVEGRNSSS